MSIVCETLDGWVLSHYDFVSSVYKNVQHNSELHNYSYRPGLFNICSRFMRDDQALKQHKREGRKILNNFSSKKVGSHPEPDREVSILKEKFEALVKYAKEVGKLCGQATPEECTDNNRLAREEANRYYDSIPKNEVHFAGGNETELCIVAEFLGLHYLIPPKCLFFNNEIKEVSTKLINCSFDFILMDPPWWNKFVRRKRKLSNKGYHMLRETSLETIPIKTLLKEDGLLAIWTTNSPSLKKFVIEQLIPMWGLEYVAIWFWIKVTKFGEAIVPFSSSLNKQPYEQIIFACKVERCLPKPESNKCLISVPSAIHSHKPPLSDVLKPYLPSNPECLELFARYLMPSWTSFGNQVLSLQLLSLFDKI